MSDDLLFERIGDTGVVTFNRPDSRNALTFEMYEGLATYCKQVLDKSLDIRSLIVTGAGDKAFAAGTDISNFKDFKSEEDALGYERTMDRVLGLFESLPIPTVAAIRGACTGGGAAIAACCDIRLSSDDIRYGSVGNLSRLVTLLGASRTREILMTSRLIAIDEALSIGLVNELAEDPLARAQELCSQLSKMAPLTIAATKEGLRRLREHGASVEGDDLIVQCYTSADFREGMDAFLNKRKPDWKGC